MSPRVTKITMLVDTAQGQASVAELNASLTGNEKAFQANAVAASASLTQVERLLSQKAQLARATAANSLALKEESAALADMQLRSQQSASMQRQLSAEIARTEQIILGLLVTQRELAISTAENNVAMKAFNAAQNETSTAAALTTRQMVQVGGAIDRLGGVAVPGARAISMIAGSLSLATLGTLALVAGIALLIGWIWQRVRAEEKLIEINDQALKLDLARAKTAEGQQNLTKDLTAILLQYSNGVKALAADQLKETDAYYALRDAQKIEDQMKAQGIERSLQARLTGQLLGISLEDQRRKYEELTKKRQDDESSLHKTIEALIQFARESNQSTAQILAAARAYGVAGKALADLTVELTGAALAQRRLNAAIEAQKAPQVDYTKTREGILPLQDSVKGGMAEAAAAGVKRYDDQIRANSKSLGELSSAVKNHTIAMKDLDAETQRAVSRHQQLNETHRSGAGAVRAYANELVNLTKKAEDAEAALLGDSFARREAAIQADIKAQREHLVINKRDREAANEAIDRQEHARLEKLGNDRIAAEQRVMAEIAKINIEGMESVISRKRRSEQLEVALRVEALKKEFGDTAQTQDLIVLYRQAKDREYARWLLDLTTKNAEARKDAEFRMLDEVEAERLKRDKRILDEVVKREIATMKRIAEIAKDVHVDLRLASPQQIDQLRRLDDQLIKIGLDVRRVDQIFGTTSRTVAELAARIQVLGTMSPHQMDQLKNKIDLVRDSFMAVFNAVAAGFEAMISGSESFGKAFLQSILGALGQIAAAWGAFYIATGVGELFLPGAHHAGVVHIAQGGALLALAGALAGASSLIGKSGSSGGGGGSAESSGSTGAGATGAGSNRAVQPALVDVRTSPRSSLDSWVDRVFGENRRRADQEAVNRRNVLRADSGPITIELHMGAGEATSFLNGVMDGKGVIRLDNLGHNKQRIKHALGVR